MIYIVHYILILIIGIAWFKGVSDNNLGDIGKAYIAFFGMIIGFIIVSIVALVDYLLI